VKNPTCYIPILILLPVISGILCYLIKNKTVRNIIIFLNCGIIALLAILLKIHGSIQFTPKKIGPFSWDSIVTIADFGIMIFFIYIAIRRKHPLSIILASIQMVMLCVVEWKMLGQKEIIPAFNADQLSLIMVMLVSIVGSITVIYAIPYMEELEKHEKLKVSRQPRFFFFIVLFLGAMNGLVMTNNLMWLYLFWEITTLCCVMLIGHNGTDEAIESSNRALWMNIIGGIAILAGVVALQYQGQSLSIQHLIESTTFRGIALIPIAFLCLAGFTKSAQMPFEGWLLGAMVAPTPVSALLHSSTMVKAGVYIIIRFAPAYKGTSLSTLIAIIGSFTFMSAALLAISQRNAKKLLAYSTISNLGLIISCAGLNTPLAITAGIMLIIYHAVSKALLFMAVGVIDHHIWSRKIEQMQGLLFKMPLTTIVTIVGIFSLILPPFGALVAKWISIEASVHIPIEMLMLVFGSAFTVLYYVKWIGRLITEPPGQEKLKIEELPVLSSAPLVILALASVILSLSLAIVETKVIIPAVMEYYGTPGMEVLGDKLVDQLGSFPMLILSAAFILTLVLPLIFLKVKKEDIGSVYLCGEQVEDLRRKETMFRTSADLKRGLDIGGYYFENFIKEKPFSRWMNAVAIVLIVVLFGVVIL